MQVGLWLELALNFPTNVSPSGPPPLEQEKIDEIPKCEIVQEQVDAKLQCSVCWEDFLLKESVRQLPCSVTSPLNYIPTNKVTNSHDLSSTFTTSRAFCRG
jgi:hypothetical protein